MNYLLDTCALLHLVNDSATLPAASRTAIADPSARIHLSVITAAELSIKSGKGKLSLPMAVVDWTRRACELHHLLLLPLDLPPAAAAGQLPWIHSDPFDRILIATALERDLTLITSDQEIPKYPGLKVLWQQPAR